MFVVWEPLASAVTGRRSWLLALVTVLLGIGFVVLIGGNAAAGQPPQPLPNDSDSAQVNTLARQFPGGDRAPRIVVVSRADGAVLGTSDIGAAQANVDAAGRIGTGMDVTSSVKRLAVPNRDLPALRPLRVRRYVAEV